jgi:hypothetical protein
VRWTVFKSQLCGFAAQKYSTKPQLKNCRLARRYVRQNVKAKSFGEIVKSTAKAKAGSWFCKFSCF